MLSSQHSLAAALVLVTFVGACGDDSGGPDSSTRDSESGTDAAPDGSDGAVSTCTAVPSIIETGLTAPADPGINPADFDDGVEAAFAPAAVAQSGTTFPLGVQAGAMRADSVLLWTNAPGQTPTLRVWRDSDTAGAVELVYDASVTPDSGGYVHAPVDNLAPATVYRYAFLVPTGTGGFSSRSPIGRFRTAPAADSALKLRFGATVCTGFFREPQRTNTLPYPSLSLLAEENLDALLHLGDMSYNDAATTLAGYRAEWARTLKVQGYRDVLASTGMYFIWDDHEVIDNWSGQTVQPERLVGAKTTMLEALALETGDAGQLWGSYAWGTTAEVLIADVRSERRPSSRESSSPQFIGAAQMAFFKDRLLNTSAHFKLVMTSVNMANLPGVWDAAADDRWEGYGAQREELLDFIVDNDIDNVWFLTGDIHMGYVGRLEPEGHRHARMWEITVGPGASAPNAIDGLVNSGLLAAEDVFPCNQFVWWTGLTHVATTLELDPLANTLIIKSVDAKTRTVLYEATLQQEPF